MAGVSIKQRLIEEREIADERLQFAKTIPNFSVSATILGLYLEAKGRNDAITVATNEATIQKTIQCFQEADRRLCAALVGFFKATPQGLRDRCHALSLSPASRKFRTVEKRALALEGLTANSAVDFPIALAHYLDANSVLARMEYVREKLAKPKAMNLPPGVFTPGVIGRRARQQRP